MNTINCFIKKFLCYFNPNQFALDANNRIVLKSAPQSVTNDLSFNPTTGELTSIVNGVSDTETITSTFSLQDSANIMNGATSTPIQNGDSVIVENGLNVDANKIGLGGTLNKQTVIAHAGHDVIFSGSSVSKTSIQANGDVNVGGQNLTIAGTDGNVSQDGNSANLRFGQVAETSQTHMYALSETGATVPNRPFRTSKYVVSESDFIFNLPSQMSAYADYSYPTNSAGSIVAFSEDTAIVWANIDTAPEKRVMLGFSEKGKYYLGNFSPLLNSVIPNTLDTNAVSLPEKLNIATAENLTIDNRNGQIIRQPFFDYEEIPFSVTAVTNFTPVAPISNGWVPPVPFTTVSWTNVTATAKRVDFRVGGRFHLFPVGQPHFLGEDFGYVQFMLQSAYSLTTIGGSSGRFSGFMASVPTPNALLTNINTNGEMADSFKVLPGQTLTIAVNLGLSYQRTAGTLTGYQLSGQYDNYGNFTVSNWRN